MDQYKYKYYKYKLKYLSAKSNKKIQTGGNIINNEIIQFIDKYKKIKDEYENEDLDGDNYRKYLFDLFQKYNETLDNFATNYVKLINDINNSTISISEKIIYIMKIHKMDISYNDSNIPSLKKFSPFMNFFGKLGKVTYSFILIMKKIEVVQDEIEKNKLQNILNDHPILNVDTANNYCYSKYFNKYIYLQNYEKSKDMFLNEKIVFVSDNLNIVIKVIDFIGMGSYNIIFKIQTLYIDVKNVDLQKLNNCKENIYILKVTSSIPANKNFDVIVLDNDIKKIINNEICSVSLNDNSAYIYTYNGKVLSSVDLTDEIKKKARLTLNEFNQKYCHNDVSLQNMTYCEEKDKISMIDLDSMTVKNQGVECKKDIETGNNLFGDVNKYL